MVRVLVELDPCILPCMMIQCFTLYADKFPSNTFVVIIKKCSLCNVIKACKVSIYYIAKVRWNLSSFASAQCSIRICWVKYTSLSLDPFYYFLGKCSGQGSSFSDGNFVLGFFCFFSCVLWIKFLQLSLHFCKMRPNLTLAGCFTE